MDNKVSDQRIEDAIFVYGAVYGIGKRLPDINEASQRMIGLLKHNSPTFFGHLWQYLWILDSGEKASSIEGIPSTQEVGALIKSDKYKKYAGDGYHINKEKLRKELPGILKGSGRLTFANYLALRQRKRVFENPLVEQFYKMMAENYLDYYTVFEQMGIDEPDWVDLIREDDFKKAMKRSEQRMVRKCISLMGQEGLEKGNKGKVDSFLRNIQEEENDTGDLMKSLVGEARKPEQFAEERYAGDAIIMQKDNHKDLMIDSSGATKDELEGTIEEAKEPEKIKPFKF